MPEERTGAVTLKGNPVTLAGGRGKVLILQAALRAAKKAAG